MDEIKLYSPSMIPIVSNDKANNKSMKPINFFLMIITFFNV